MLGAFSGVPWEEGVLGWALRAYLWVPWGLVACRETVWRPRALGLVETNAKAMSTTDYNTTNYGPNETMSIETNSDHFVIHGAVRGPKVITD